MSMSTTKDQDDNDAAAAVGAVHEEDDSSSNNHTTTTRQRPRSNSSDSVDSLGRIKRRREDREEEEEEENLSSGDDEGDDSNKRRRRRRSRSAERGRNGGNKNKNKDKDVPQEEKEEEESELGAVLPLPPPSAVPDTRSTVKIFADAPPKEVALAPPPPRRRRRGGAEGAAATTATSTAAAVVSKQPPPPAAASPSSSAPPAAAVQTAKVASRRSPSPSKRRPPRMPSSVSPQRPSNSKPHHRQEQEEDEEEEEDMDLALETEKEREERELAERRARREKLLAQYGGGGGGGGGAGTTSVNSSMPPSPTMSTNSLVSLEKKEKEREKEKENSAVAATKASSSAAAAAAAAAASTGTDTHTKDVLLRTFLDETRKRQEDAMGGSEEVEEEEGGIGAGRDSARAQAEAAAAVESGMLKRQELDIFSAEGAELEGLTQSLLVDGRAAGLKALGGGGLKEQRDAEGYFQHRVGEKLRGRYKILGIKGRGVFSSVLLAQDEQAPPSSPDSAAMVAIKVLRGNDLMLQAGLKEALLLRELTKDDPKDQAHVIHLHEDFRLGEHLCLVMEAMHVNLRKLLKTYGANQGLAVKAVLNYTNQLLVGLAYLQQKGIVHADLKPDNIVVNEKFSLLKICDFGSAMRIKEFEDLDDVPYLQSRFYRAPEVMLGYTPRGCAIDMWSAATSMYELYTAQVLFPGRHNNEVLKNMMKVRGPFARRLLKKASPTLRTQHFEDVTGNFLLHELDLAGRNETVRSVPQVTAPTKQLGELLAPPRLAAKMPAEVKVKVEQLKNFLEQALVLDPTKRITPVEGLQLLQGGR